MRTLGSADTVTVGDLAGTDIAEINVDLGAFDGSGDGAADNVVGQGHRRADDVDRRLERGSGRRRPAERVTVAGDEAAPTTRSRRRRRQRHHHQRAWPRPG